MNPFDFDALLQRNCVLMKDYISKTNKHLNTIKTQLRQTQNNDNGYQINKSKVKIEDDDENDSFEDKVKQISLVVPNNKLMKNHIVLNLNNNHLIELSFDTNRQKSCKKIKTTHGIKVENPVKYINKISKLKMTILKLINENASLKSQIEKEKEKAKEFKSITHSILLLYDK